MLRLYPPCICLNAAKKVAARNGSKLGMRYGGATGSDYSVLRTSLRDPSYAVLCTVSDWSAEPCLCLDRDFITKLPSGVDLFSVILGATDRHVNYCVIHPTNQNAQRATHFLPACTAFLLLWVLHV